MADGHNCEHCTDSSCKASQKLNGENSKDFQERQELAKKLCGIKHCILVLSGKGGVGKSTVAINLATALAMEGFKTGLLDIDIHGPSIPFVFRHAKEKITQNEKGGVNAPEVMAGLKAMSIGFFLDSEDQALIWRGPMKIGTIKQFLNDVEWGELDYMIVDCPPGTGDEPLSICQMMPKIDGAVIVTTPQNMAITDVRKSVTFCNQVAVPVTGIIENMSGFKCPCCGKITDIFQNGGGEKLAAEMDIPFLGKIPIEPGVMTASEEGKVFIGIAGNTDTGKAFTAIIEKIRENVEKE